MNCKNDIEIYKEDDYRAFGGCLFEVEATFPPEMLDGHTISKAELGITDDLVLVYDNPVFPLRIALTSEQTKVMNHINTCRLKVYDENGYGVTCDGQLQITANEKAVKSVQSEV